MKKLLLSLSLILLFYMVIHAGGVITNTNQSASYIRMLARDATIGLDGAYYNPAGLSFLTGDGIFISLNEQYINQNREIQSNYAYLNSDAYKGQVKVPFFPGFYACYKKGKIAVSLGFNPIGGGGSAEFNKGLPSFEYGPSDLIPGLNTTQGVTAYQMDVSFKGSSVYLGTQLNISYKINDRIAVSIGGRYVTAKETYDGYLRNIQVNPTAAGGTFIPASNVMTGVATNLQTASDNLTAAISGGALQANDPLEDATAIATLTALGLYATGMTNQQAAMTFGGAAFGFNDKAYLLGDQSVDVIKKGAGFAPMVGIDIKPNEKINFAIKYEFNTGIELENETKEDVSTAIVLTTRDTITMFPDGAKTNLDIPAMLSLGATFRPVEKLLLSTGIHYYFDKNADWGGKEDSVENNCYELQLGAEYQLAEKIALSAGYIFIKSGVSNGYQSDMSYHLSSNTIGCGGVYKLSDMIDINLGVLYSMYADTEKNFYHDVASSGNMVLVTETYKKNTLIFALGVDIKLVK